MTGTHPKFRRGGRIAASPSLVFCLSLLMGQDDLQADSLISLAETSRLLAFGKRGTPRF